MKRFFQVLSFDVLAKVVLGLVSLALIRFMPVEQFAAFTLAVSVATLAAQALAGGFNRIYVVGYEALALAGRAGAFLGFQLALVALLALAGTLAAAALGGLYPAAVALALGIVLSEFAKTYYQRELRFGRYSAIEVGRAAGQALGVGLLIAVYRDALGAAPVIWVQAAALALSFAVAAAAALRWADVFAPAAIARVARTVLGGAYGYLLAYFGVLAVFSQIDVLMVKALADEHTLATYGSALRYYGLLSLALGAVHAVLLPAIQRAATAAELRRLYREHFRLVLLFAPAVALGAWLAGWVLPWVDGGRYPDAVTAFRLLAASAVVSFAFSPHVNLLLKRGRFRFLFLLIVAASAVALAANLALIPRFGAPGAALATAIASACVTVPIFFLARRLSNPAGAAHRQGAL